MLSRYSLQVLEKLCVEYGKLSDIATGTGKTMCCVWKVVRHRYRYWKNCVLSMESSQTSLQVLDKMCAEYEKFSDIVQVLEKLCADYGKFSDIVTGTGKTAY